MTRGQDGTAGQRARSTLRDARKVWYAGCNRQYVRWLLPLSVLATLAGYFGPWVPHAAAGLVVTGLDLGEYVKFLHEVRGGEIELWRQGFYLPLVAVSVALSLHAYRRDLAYPWPIKGTLLAVAAVAAFNLLPPAWSPPLLLTPEFRLQTLAMIVCLGLAAISPILALLPRQMVAALVALSAISALWLPIHNFLRVLPAIAQLYGHPLTPGWGIWGMGLGLVGMMGVGVFELLSTREENRAS